MPSFLENFRSKDNLELHRRSYHGLLPWNKEVSGHADKSSESRRLNCKVCENDFLPVEMEAHLRFSHGIMPVRRPGEAAAANNISEVADAILRTLTPQPDYLLRCLTPLPMDTLDDFIT